MSIEDRIEAAKNALSRGDVIAAAEVMLAGQFEAAMKCRRQELLEWAFGEQSEGYGLKAEILERLAEMKRR